MDNVAAAKRQVALEWFQACEELRDTVAGARPDSLEVDRMASKVRDRLERVVERYGPDAA